MQGHNAPTERVDHGVTGADGVRELIDDRYELDELLGRGGFGEVWRAKDSRVGRWVAVKIGYPQTYEDTRRFEQEARLAGNLAHPNIATLHDFGRTERAGRSAVFLVMELLQGRSLDGVLADGVPPLADALDWTMQVAAALGAAHDAGVVHRDVKPANVMVTEEAGSRRSSTSASPRPRTVPGRS